MSSSRHYSQMDMNGAEFDPLVLLGKYDHKFDRSFFTKAYGREAERAIQFYLGHDLIYEVKGFMDTYYRLTPKGRCALEEQNIFPPTKTGERTN